MNHLSNIIEFALVLKILKNEKIYFIFLWENAL